MMDRVEQNLGLLEDTRSGKSNPFQPIRRRRYNLFKIAIQIIENWYEKHTDHPYPDSLTVELIAIQGDIIAGEVKNKRIFSQLKSPRRNVRLLFIAT
jgi:hypothetical protein